MNSSTVAFTSSTADDRALDELGARFDEVVRGIVAEDAVVAASDARRARLVAEAASLSDRMAVVDGSAATSTGREWARRRLGTEIACATHRSERAVARLVDDSEKLVQHLPLTLAALERATISYSHARAMIAHAITLPEDSRSAFEQHLLPHAEALPPHKFDDRARRLREREHPDSIVTRTKAARDERYVAFQPDTDGMATLYHHLPVIEAMAIDDLIDKLARADRATEPGNASRADRSTESDSAFRADGTDHSEPTADTRTHAQRRCDALTDLILGRRDRPRITPTVLVTAPAATIAGASDEPGDLHGYGFIDADTTREIAATAPTFLRALLSPETGEPTTITRHRHRPAAGQGRDRHDPSRTLRTALAIFDETCRFPGCGRRANRCELDHTKAWADGGTTTPDNLAHLCTRHHHLKHEGGWKVAPSRDGTRTLTWTSPRGKKYATAPPAPPTQDEHKTP